jgi:hypothetical protein
MRQAATEFLHEFQHPVRGPDTHADDATEASLAAGMRDERGLAIGTGHQSRGKHMQAVVARDLVARQVLLHAPHVLDDGVFVQALDLIGLGQNL